MSCCTPWSREVIEQLRPLATAKHLQVDLHSQDPSLRVWADHDRLSQILTNLIDNAIKYTPDGATISVDLSVPDQEMAQIVVRDTGQGIPADALPKLFDPFFRVQQHERSHTKGLGLGLAIVKDLVDLHGGSISVQSTVHEGTQFSFTLPLHPHEATAPARLPTNSGRLLVVDDDPTSAICCVIGWNRTAFRCPIASDGRTALRILAETPVDGILLDIALPEVDGFDVLRQLRTGHPTLPVVMMTAVEALDRAMAAVEAGAQSYLLKPFDAVRLRRSSLVGSRRARQQLLSQPFLRGDNNACRSAQPHRATRFLFLTLATVTLYTLPTTVHAQTPRLQGQSAPPPEWAMPSWLKPTTPRRSTTIRPA